MSNPTSHSDKSAFLNFALSLAQAAEAKILPHYRQHKVDFKADGTEVTLADRQAEAIMREQIKQAYPDHDILGEEYGGSQQSTNRYQWILDPIDGTTWFTLGVPLFGTLIALLEDGQPIVGVIHLPMLGETLYAATGMGCWFQVKGEAAVQTQVVPKLQLDQAFVSASGVHSSDIHLQDNQIPYRVSALINQANRFRFCSDCAQYVLLCRGKIHAALDTLMNPWDVAALIPCIEEAGGIVTSATGERDNVIYAGSLLASSSPALQSEILAVLQPNLDEKIQSRQNSLI
jgi:histidinol-phosphatase